jgi:hypothetical protein
MPSDVSKRTCHELKIDWDGAVFSSGIPSRHATQQQDARNVQGVMTRAVVTAVYYVDDKAPMIPNAPGAGEQTRRNILCDVRTYGRVSRVLHCVPVLQRVQGVWDEDTYVPRPTRGTIDGSELTTEVPYTPPGLMDGDHVIIGFLENDPAQPVILPFTLGHPATQTPARLKPDVPTEWGAPPVPRTRRIRHGGTILEWNEVGDFQINATEAAKADYVNGAEVGNAGNSGTILIKTMDGGGGIVKLELNKLGNAIVQNGGGEALFLQKANGRAFLYASQTVDIQAPTVTVLATSKVSVTAPKVEVTSVDVILGSALAQPLVKFPAWAPFWELLNTEVLNQIVTYSGGPLVVAVADYLKLLTLLQAVTVTYKTLTTVLVKAS